MVSKPTGKYVESTVGGETVRAFLPDSLPPRFSQKDLQRLAEPLRQAEAALDHLRLAGQMIPSLNWFVYSFVRKEALISSEIEGTQATLTDVMSYEQIGRPGSSNPEDVEEVTNYIRASNFAFEQIGSPDGLPVSVRLFNECHAILMNGVRGKDKQPGELRRSQVWVGGTRPGNAQFVPPPSNDVAGLLSDLERYIHEDDDLPALLRVAAAHVQFETIHPYLDGNGRMGRMLTVLLLSHWKVLDAPLLYLSLFLKQHQATYYDLLNRVRTAGTWVEWSEFFLEGIASVAADAVKTASALHQQIDDDRARILQSGIATVSAIALFELLPASPVVTMPMVTKMLDTTKPTAGKAIKVLEDVNVLMEVGDRKRDRLYLYSRYLEILG